MSPRILVADDDDGLRQLFRLVLQKEGFEVIEASDGEEALARALDSSPALILLDVMMPRLNGYEVCRRLKSDQRTWRVPVIFVSAMEGVKQSNEAQRLGADGCIKKPIGPHDLVVRLKSFLNSHNAAWVA